MIVTKQNLQLLVGVLLIYCCIESTVGRSIYLLNENEPNATTTIKSDDGTMTSTESTQTTVTKKVYTYSIWPHVSTTTGNPSSTSDMSPKGGLFRLLFKNH